MTRCIVLGRFQPFHLGHASLVEAAIDHAQGDEVVVAIGSAQSWMGSQQSMDSGRAYGHGARMGFAERTFGERRVH